tara:strand:- start:54 stop:674 length:621 start_codon:yes stop_codon:yes gene_type:complete
MFLAISSNKERIPPSKSREAYCPACSAEVIAKMGSIKAHHWAHKLKSDCDYGKGMTEWHYRWIERHYNKPGWQVEHIDEGRRYDCFNAGRGLVVEVQKAAKYEYILEKTREIIRKGYALNWILHAEIMSSLERNADSFIAKDRRRLVILDLLQELSELEQVSFFVDLLANSAKGKSSKGLLRLQPVVKNVATYSDYYEVPYIKHEK